jgi:DNA-binding XRE family transcriptional regulator
MSYVTQKASPVVHASHAHPTDREPSPSPRIATRLIFERRVIPHPYNSLSHAGNGPRPVTAINGPAKNSPANPHKDVSTRFGMRLKQLRVERQLTQVRMAREFGLDRSYISDVERGRKSISLPTMEVFALGLKLSLAELLTGI